MEITVKRPTEEELKELRIYLWGKWECDPTTFDWYYNSTELCYLMEGEATVETETYKVVLKKGDLVTFPKGVACVWKVHKKVQKRFKCE